MSYWSHPEIQYLPLTKCFISQCVICSCFTAGINLNLLPGNRSEREAAEPGIQRDLLTDDTQIQTSWLPDGRGREKNESEHPSALLRWRDCKALKRLENAGHVWRIPGRRWKHGVRPCALGLRLNYSRREVCSCIWDKALMRSWLQLGTPEVHTMEGELGQEERERVFSF